MELPDSPEAWVRGVVVVTVLLCFVAGLHRRLKGRVPVGPRRVIESAVVVGLIVLTSSLVRSPTTTYRLGEFRDDAAELPLSWSAIDLFMSEMVEGGTWTAPLVLQVDETPACPTPHSQRPRLLTETWLSKDQPLPVPWNAVRLHFRSFGSRVGERIEISATQSVGLIYVAVVSIEPDQKLRLLSIEKESFPVCF